MVEAMKLPGVYTACPEHVKRRYWAEQERVLNLAASGEAQPITALFGKEGRKVRLVRPGASDVEGIFKEFEGPYAVVLSDHDVLPYRVDNDDQVFFL
jgi:hypothetical protein